MFMTDGEAGLILEASRIKIPYLELENLRMTETMLKNFQLGENAVNLSAEINWAYVIPR